MRHEAIPARLTGHAMPEGNGPRPVVSLGLPRRGAARGGTDRARLARADNLWEEHEHEHSTIAVPFMLALFLHPNQRVLERQSGRGVSSI